MNKQQRYQLLELYDERTFPGDEAMAAVAEAIALSSDDMLETDTEPDGLLHVVGTRFYLRKVEESR